MNQSGGLHRRGFLQLAGLAGLGSTLAACGLGEEDKGSGGSRLNFWLTPNASPEAMKQFTDQMASGFQQVSKGARVSSLVIPWENALTKYTAAFSGGNPPDLTYQIIPWMNKWRSTGVLADFKQMASKEELASFTDGQPESYLKAATGDKGELFAVPFTQGFQPLAMNLAAWEKAGKPPLPTTLEGMIPFAEAMTFDKKGRNLKDPGFDKNNVEHYGMSWPALPTAEDNWVWQYFWAYGSDYINESKDDIGFNSPEGREALEVMKRLVTSGATAPPTLFADPTRWDTATISGKTAMQWMTPLTNDMCKQFPTARLKVIDLPSGPAGKAIVAGCGYYAMAAKSKKPELTYQFAKYLLDPKQADVYIRLALGLPTRPVQGNYYAEPLADPRMNTFLNEASAYGEHARATLVLPYQPQEYLLGKINDYLFGRQSLDAMISEASKGIRQMAKSAK
ncbi:extracellular solute-binding protein [Micromonospora yasonensis]|uniref:ABC transporter substrate-binding protein n=1 Tax=Micromonospora yasonensis TaxID=1128667 RepID=UPI00222EFCA3|nr:extracellular solute-binding protein [Micromonospora yasonensis]MCW3844128.1 extracellular solute-binding protein [Micromonospora yasonensis]